MMFGEKTDPAEARRIIDRALDAGVNLIDVADVYAGGESERIVGAALQGRRHAVVLATKCGRRTDSGEGLSRRHILQAAEASLRRLGTDYIDLYQVHLWDPAVPLEETLGALDELVRQGKVRHVGCSNWAAWQLMKSLWISDRHGWTRMESVQPRYNLVYREAGLELLPACLDQGVGVLAYSPLAGGILTGKYLAGIPAGARGFNNPNWQKLRLTPAARQAAQAVVDAAAALGRPPGQVAINWVLAHPAVTAALVGPRTLEQWEEALGAAGWTLPPEAAAALAP